jgi:hypothetical protein
MYIIALMVIFITNKIVAGHVKCGSPNRVVPGKILALPNTELLFGPFTLLPLKILDNYLLEWAFCIRYTLIISLIIVLVIDPASSHFLVIVVETCSHFITENRFIF